jgi:alpha-mannosidase
MTNLAIKNRLAVSAVLLLASLLLPLHAAAQNRTVWSIGTFDYSSGEFRSQDIDYNDLKSDLVFEIGKNADKDFYRFQPGPANGITGGRLHPFTIKFNLDESPRGVYYLKVGMLFETPRLSILNLTVNRHSGNFYFHPTLDFKAGDWEGTFVPQTSYDQKTIAFPASWLKKGANEFVLTAVDDPATPLTALGAIAPGHTGLIYDALQLQQNASASYDTKSLETQIIPSIFYRYSPKGIAEIVDVFIGAGKWPKISSTELNVAGHAYTKSATASGDFGERHFEFQIPEWSGEADASVKVGGLTAKTVKIAPAKKWNLAIIPHEHLDVGFTDYAAKVAELHSQSIDAAMGLIVKTPDFRWTLDGSWVAEQYLNGRSPVAQQQFIEHVRNGSIVIPPEYSNQHTGNASWEALAHSFYYRRQLEKRFNLERSDAAQIVDVPSYTWGYESALHDAGIKYLVAASNSWRAPIMLHGRWNEKSPFYWEGPDGSRVMMWYSRAYLQGHTLFGGPWSMEAVRDALPVFLQAYTRPDYTADTAIIFGTQLENTPLAKEQSEIVARVSQEFAWPKIEYSTVHTAMQRIEGEWKGKMPVYRGDFGPYWEDGYGSQAQFTAVHRQNQHRISTAEVMGAAASSIDPLIRTDRTLLNDAWRNELVFDEHTWTYVGATTQPEHRQTEDQLALKGTRAVRARNDISESIQRSWAQLEVFVKPKHASVMVFNSLNWARDGLIETDLPDGSKLVDTSDDKDVPLEVIFKGKGISLPGFGPGSVRVRFVANDVPPMGYKLYTIKPATADASQVSEIHGEAIENQFYRITVDPPTGAISSIFDKQLGRELVDATSHYKFGAYLYVSGGDDYPNNSLYRFGNALKLPTLTVHPANSGQLISARTTPIGSVITLASSAPNTPAVKTEIVLLNSEKKILITYHLTKDKVLNRESAYIAFPFAIAQPEFAYGSQSAWVNPAKDELPGGSREWYLPSTWSAVHDQQSTAAVVALDAPLTNFGDIVRAEWPTEFKPKSSAIFSWLMNNYWGTNFPAWQGGDFVFRYAITNDAKFDPPALTRFGWNALTSLEHDDIGASTDPSLLPQAQASLIDIEAPNVTLLTWKEAEDSAGTILRVQETSGIVSNVAIRSKFLSIQQAWLCDALEDKQSELKADAAGISVSIQPFQTLTIRMKTIPNKN